MNNTQASPAGENRGGQTKRVMLTRGELVKMLGRFADFVKDRDPQDFPGWVDGIFDEAERDGTLVFDAKALAGKRLFLHDAEGRN